ncbi:hypothetical protein [Alterinioella nitratireducens]|nr:hypothetical protein [Alterinioella nitratireducens]NPD19574.1 hypothetical protein [Alterinioella nitratireducens]
MLRAVVSEAARALRRARFEDGLTPHLRRDLGLPPSQPPPPKRQFDF